MIERIGHCIATAFYVVAGPYYAYQIIIAAAPILLAIFAADQFKDDQFLIRAGLVLAGIIVGGAIFISLRRRQYLHSISISGNPSIEILDHSVAYEVKANDNYECQYTIKIRALADGISQYRQRFSWSGLDDARVLRSNGARVHIELLSNDSYNALIFNFDPLRKKGEHVLAARIGLRDAAKKVRPFYAFTVTHPIKRMLIISLSFDESARPSVCRKRIYPSKSSRIPIRGGSADIPIDDAHNPMKTVIARPRLNRTYSFEWETKTDRVQH